MKAGNNLGSCQQSGIIRKMESDFTFSISFRASPFLWEGSTPLVDWGRLASSMMRLVGDLELAFPSSNDAPMSLFDLGMDAGAAYFWLSTWRSLCSFSCRKDDAGVCLPDSMLPFLDSRDVGLDAGLGDGDGLMEEAWCNRYAAWALWSLGEELMCEVNELELWEVILVLEDREAVRG